MRMAGAVAHLVALRGGAQAVRDEERGAPLAHRAERAQDAGLRAAVQRACRLVEQQDAGGLRAAEHHHLKKHKGCDNQQQPTVLCV